MFEAVAVAAHRNSRQTPGRGTALRRSPSTAARLRRQACRADCRRKSATTDAVVEKGVVDVEEEGDVGRRNGHSLQDTQSPQRRRGGRPAGELVASLLRPAPHPDRRAVCRATIGGLAARIRRAVNPDPRPCSGPSPSTLLRTSDCRDSATPALTRREPHINFSSVGIRPREGYGESSSCASSSSKTIGRSRASSRAACSRKGTRSTSCTKAAARPNRRRAVDYDAVVLDLMLPGRSGFQVLRDIRARKAELPGHHPDREGFDRRTGHRARRRRRRLHGQAVRARRAVGAPARAAAPRTAARDHAARWPISRWTPSGAPSGAPDGRST